MKTTFTSESCKQNFLAGVDEVIKDERSFSREYAFAFYGSAAAYHDVQVLTNADFEEVVKYIAKKSGISESELWEVVV